MARKKYEELIIINIINRNLRGMKEILDESWTSVKNEKTTAFGNLVKTYMMGYFHI